MKQFKVTFIKYDVYYIDAETEEDAEDIAIEKLQNINPKMKYFDEVEIEEIK